MSRARKIVEQLPEAPSKPQRAPGVAYTEVSGLQMFACGSYRATLTLGGCASRWREAQVSTRGEAADRVMHCRSCSIGALHAGYAPVKYSPWFDVAICPRCGKGTTRMIGNRRCVSCYNREREIRTGKNARGNKPVELLRRPLHTVRIMVELNGEARLARDHATSGVPETLLHILRTTSGEIQFGFAGHRPPAANTDGTRSGVSRGAEPEAADVDGEGYWMLTDLHCKACSGQVLRAGGASGAQRCADCGADDPVIVEAKASQHSRPAGRGPRPTYFYRAALMAHTAIAPAAMIGQLTASLLCEPARRAASTCPRPS